MDPKDKRERMKHVFAVMAGGALGRALMFLVSDGYAWLGVLAGFALGYLCYDLREVQREAPRAWNATMTGASATLRFVFAKRPLVHTALVCAVVALHALAVIGSMSGKPQPPTSIMLIVFFMCWMVFTVALPWATTAGAACFGYKLDKWDALPFLFHSDDPYVDAEGLPVKTTYFRLWSWCTLGIGVLLVKGFLALIIDLPVFAWRFSVNLVRRIHSSDRLFCGLYASISATISLYAMSGKDAALGEMLGITAATALIAYAVLHAGWKITAALLKDGEEPV